MVEIFDFPYQRLEKTFSEYRIANLGGFCNYNILLLLASSFVEHALFLLFFLRVYYAFCIIFDSFEMPAKDRRTVFRPAAFHKCTDIFQQFCGFYRTTFRSGTFVPSSLIPKACPQPQGFSVG